MQKQQPSLTLKHNAQLDGARGVAIILVILFHLKLIYWGWLGVQLFFVLSGFLITHGLIKNKGMNFKDHLKVFYIKRALRIFPLYFLFLLVISIVFLFTNTPNTFSQDWAYLYSYSYNLKRLLSGYQHSPYYSHFWTLAVEEQFYLVWPFIIHFTQASRIKQTLIKLCIVITVIKTSVSILYITGTINHVNIIGQLYFNALFQADAFIFGAIVATLPKETISKISRFFIPLLIISIIGFAAIQCHSDCRPTAIARIMAAPSMFSEHHAFSYAYTLSNIIFALLIATTLCSHHTVISTFMAKILTSKPLTYTGKISYGLYVFHYPIIGAVKKQLLNPTSTTMWLLTMLGCIVASYLVAACSYRYFEKPFLDRKNRLLATQN